MHKLTPKEQRFCEEYLSDFNGTAAAQRAGYSSKSYEALRQQASQLLTKPHIAMRLFELKAERSRRVGISQERVLQELARIAFSCIADVVDFDDAEVKLKEAPSPDVDYLGYMEWRDNMSCLAEFNKTSTEDKTSCKVKLHDKTKALTLLMKHLGMLNDFDMAISCLREKYGLSLTRDDDGMWQVIDLSRIQPH